MSNHAETYLSIWKTYNDTNRAFLDSYRSMLPSSPSSSTTGVSASSSSRVSQRTGNRRTPYTTVSPQSNNTAATPHWIQQLFSTERSPYVTDISYSWIFEIPANTLASSSASAPERLTQKQIQENTTSFVFQNEHVDQLNTLTCPISHSDFQVGDILCEIGGCKHVFKQGEILRWFDINTSCPVCRTPVVRPTSSAPTDSSIDISSSSTSNRSNTNVGEGSRGSRILEEIILTPMFSTQPPNAADQDELTNIMNEALESIFSRRPRP